MKSKGVTWLVVRAGAALGLLMFNTSIASSADHCVYCDVGAGSGGYYEFCHYNADSGGNDCDASDSHCSTYGACFTR